MNRTPPPSAIKQLRKEVGFGCPVPGCRSPFLSWHHFDPPWRIEQHHNPRGMIALCREHHDKADAGAFTKSQLKAFKKRAKRQRIRGEFNWLRNKILVVAGGSYYYETPRILSVREKPIIWFERDSRKRLLLNLLLPTLSGEPRGSIQNNWWYDFGNADDIKCPPNGRSVEITYANGDSFNVELKEFEDEASLGRKYPGLMALLHQDMGPGLDKYGIETISNTIEYPLTVIEAELNVAGTKFQVSPKSLAGTNIKGSLFVNCGSAVNIN